ncbi:MAG: hypothetical protein QXU09_04175, partial [Thermoproteota archaeon]
MGFSGKAAGLLLALLLLTYEFNSIILFLSPKGSAGGAADMAFLRGQLEDGSPPDVPFLERGYVAPEGVDNSIVDGIWLGIAPLISLGYAEDEITKEARGAGFPRELQINDNRVLVDYSNLRVSRNLDDGEVSVEIPLVCNFPLPSAYYEVKGVKKRVKLYNVTCIRYYNVSLNTRRLHDVTYAGETSGFSKAVLSESQHVVAKLFTKELLEKLGYIILEEESLYDLGNRRYVYFDFKTETPDKRIAIVECKHGDEE